MNRTKKHKTLRVLVTITIPNNMPPVEARKHVRLKINRATYRNDSLISDARFIRAAKVTPATLAQFQARSK